MRPYLPASTLASSSPAHPAAAPRAPPLQSPPAKQRCRAGEGPEEGREATKKSRRVRRRRELAGNPAEGFLVAGDGARRLRTHLWHAKRFSMARRWGFVLPIGVQGRGRGSRAVLKWLKNGTVVHDASYFIPIQLDGPEDSLLSTLRMVLCPSPADETPGLKHLQDQVMRALACWQSSFSNCWTSDIYVAPILKGEWQIGAQRRSDQFSQIL